MNAGENGWRHGGGYLRRCCCGNFMNWIRLWRDRGWKCANCGREVVSAAVFIALWMLATALMGWYGGRS